MFPIFLTTSLCVYIGFRMKCVHWGWTCPVNKGSGGFCSCLNHSMASLDWEGIFPIMPWGMLKFHFGLGLARL